MLKVENLSKEINGKVVIDSISFTINEGEIFGFLGPNGAGKSTTLKILTGIIKPTSGRILYKGYDFSAHETEIKRITGYVPEKPFTYPNLTGREHLILISKLYNIKDYHSEIEKLIKLFDLEFFIDQTVQYYPKGVLQKLSLAMAFIINPKIIFLDEPTSNLDPSSTKLVKELLLMKKREGAIIFLTTHILEIAEYLCDRVAIIESGKIIATGTIKELRNLARGSRSLEDIFLKLTGGEEILKHLSYIQ